MQRITDKPIDPATMYDLIARNSSGSVLLHYAVVKAQHGAEGTTCHVDYSLSGDAGEELRTIAAEMAASWSIEDSLLIRRVGRIGVGEIISLVAASSPSSEDAFNACKYGIGQLKKMRCIAKKEICG